MQKQVAERVEAGLRTYFRKDESINVFSVETHETDQTVFVLNVSHNPGDEESIVAKAKRLAARAKFELKKTNPSAKFVEMSHFSNPVQGIGVLPLGAPVRYRWVTELHFSINR